MGPIHPEEDRYFWDYADQMINFAAKHNLKVRGHTLCWHNQTPDWLFKKGDYDTLTKEILLHRLRNHIYKVAGRYKGQIYAWDVVNEVISDDPDEMYRNSKWFELYGEDFIFKAFQYAHEAAPDALLFYNDYNALKLPKRDKIIQLIKKLQSKNIPIHGIGLQGHWNIYSPSEEVLRNALGAYSELGIDIQITELDISIYPQGSENDPEIGDGLKAFTSAKEQGQIEQYEMIFRVFRMKFV